MDLSGAVCVLNRLLCLNAETLGFPRLRSCFKKRFWEWHPDRNAEDPDLHAAEFRELREAWRVFRAFHLGADASDGDSVSEISGDEAPYNESPYDDSFFVPATGPKFAVPDALRPFFRSPSNRRAGKLFALFATRDNCDRLQSLFSRLDVYTGNVLCFVGWPATTDRDIVVCVIQLNGERRLSDLNQEVLRHGIGPFELFYGVHFRRLIDFCRGAYGDTLFERAMPDASRTVAAPAGRFNHRLFVDWVSSHEMRDLREAMAEYAHLGEPCDRDPDSVTRDHEEDHEQQRENACKFLYLADRRRAARNALEAAAAKMHLAMKREAPEEFVSRRCRDLEDRLLEVAECELFGLADFYARYHFRYFRAITSMVLSSYLHASPRQRWTVLRGDYKSGKTSYANAFLDFFEGVGIRINTEPIRFCLAEALGRRFVLFDDVTARGLHSLDGLRDHLDGHVPVQLEKKNQQPVSQLFPPGIITCNEMEVPPALKERVQGPVTVRGSALWNRHPLEKVTVETLYIGGVLFNLLPATGALHAHIHRKKGEWWARHDAGGCDCLAGLAR